VDPGRYSQRSTVFARSCRKWNPIDVGGSGSNILSNGYNLIRDGQNIAAAPYSIGKVSTGFGFSRRAFSKIFGLSGGPFTGNAAHTPNDNLWSAANLAGTPADPATTFLLMTIDALSCTTVNSSTAGTGATCNLA
jgi:hypothetical protein